MLVESGRLLKQELEKCRKQLQERQAEAVQMQTQFQDVHTRAVAAKDELSQRIRRSEEQVAQLQKEQEELKVVKANTIAKLRADLAACQATLNTEQTNTLNLRAELAQLQGIVCSMISSDV